MKKIISVGICAVALAAAPSMTSFDRAYAGNNFWKGIGIGIGAAIVGGAIANAVRAGQQHCHQGQTYYCHSHAYANAYHYHDYQAGPILYQQVAAPPPPPAGQIVLPQPHVTWCYNHYRSYDLNSNSYQPYEGPRRPCISPYFQ
jgi:BA14K-like protein